MGSDGGWNPWGALKTRTHIIFAIERLPDDCGGALYRRCPDGTAVIALDDRSGPAQRRCDLTHELIHDELGSSCRCDGMPRAWDAVVAREETFIDREAARRLVPRHQLARFLAAQAGPHGEPVTLHDIAQHFNVTERLAEVAMNLLASVDGWGEIVA